jgi:hypothetical protein
VHAGVEEADEQLARERLAFGLRFAAVEQARPELVK